MIYTRKINLKYTEVMKNWKDFYASTENFFEQTQLFVTLEKIIEYLKNRAK